MQIYGFINLKLCCLIGKRDGFKFQKTNSKSQKNIKIKSQISSKNSELATWKLKLETYKLVYL
ncbi:hypothetical protein A7A78_06265 [Aequorivita soesokkakensis]|uniref:Uncharacterized protein n=1 Tax=Aequorivita soesokkakensis TaxID=1385699 RepID=A0A1A9LBE1_9FLAO|nr:hypothetical protein A7A78_06265 [Aequorivita soesokkakensis]